jgi:hypothetical protein
MAKRKRITSKKPAGKRAVDGFRSLKTARGAVKDTNAAAKGDPGCPRGAHATIRLNKGSHLPYEIWVKKSCRYV